MHRQERHLHNCCPVRNTISSWFWWNVNRTWHRSLHCCEPFCLKMQFISLCKRQHEWAREREREWERTNKIFTKSFLHFLSQSSDHNLSYLCKGKLFRRNLDRKKWFMIHLEDFRKTYQLEWLLLLLRRRTSTFISNYCRSQKFNAICWTHLFVESRKHSVIVMTSTTQVLTTSWIATHFKSEYFSSSTSCFYDGRAIRLDHLQIFHDLFERCYFLSFQFVI